MCSPCLITTVVWTVLIICKKPYELNEGNFTNMKEEKLDSVNNKLWYKEIFHISKSFYENRNFTNGICHTDCGPAPEIHNATKHVTNSIFINSTFSLELSVNYTCNDDLILIPPDWSNWSCIQDKNRTNSIEPRCLKSCQSPPLLKYGNFSIATAVYESMYLSGTIVEYTCDDEFAMYPPKDNKISCIQSGKWNGTIGRCCQDAYEIFLQNCEFGTDMCNWESDNEDVWTREFPGYEISVTSEGTISSSRASILIDGREYSGNYRGHNVVYIKYDQSETWSRAFNTDDDSLEVKFLVNFLKTAPYGSIIMIATKGFTKNKLLNENAEYKKVFTSLGVGTSDCPLLINDEYSLLLITKKVRTLAELPDWFRCQSLYINHGNTSLGAYSITSTSTAYLTDAYISFNGPIVPPLTESRFSINKYFIPLEEGGFCMKFRYQAYGNKGKLSVTAKGGMSGIEKELWVSRRATNWYSAQISYTDTEDSYQLSFKVDTPRTYTGTIKLDKITFTRGVC